MDFGRALGLISGARASPIPSGETTAVDDDERYSTNVGNGGDAAAASSQRLTALGTEVRRPASTPARLSVVLQSETVRVGEYSEQEIVMTDVASSVKSKGRPKGWKPGMSYAEMRGGVAPTSRAATPKAAAKTSTSTDSVRAIRPGRRQVSVPNYSLKRRRRTGPGPGPGPGGWRRDEGPTPGEMYRRLKPTFTRFLCEWAGCRADLHNLETLRRHVRVLHVEAAAAAAAEKEQTASCRWAKCAAAGGGKEGNGSCFGGTGLLLDHVEEAHMRPISWHVGDGPKNSFDWSRQKKKRGRMKKKDGGEGDDGGDEGEGEAGDEDDVPDFLKDKDGNQVTPSTRDQEVEDFITYRNNRRKLKELLIRRDENLESESEDEEGKRDGMA